MNPPRTVLVVNPGSSSLKVVVRERSPVARIVVERLGTEQGQLTVQIGNERSQRPFPGDLGAAIETVAAEVDGAGWTLDAVGHRVVHGGPGHYLPTLLTDEVVAYTVAHYSGIRPVLDEESRRAIDYARRSRAQSPDSAPAAGSSPETADERETTDDALWQALCAAPAEARGLEG